MYPSPASVEQADAEQTGTLEGAYLLPSPKMNQSRQSNVAGNLDPLVTEDFHRTEKCKKSSVLVFLQQRASSLYVAVCLPTSGVTNPLQKRACIRRR
jgi:hypothetical protein